MVGLYEITMDGKYRFAIPVKLRSFFPPNTEVCVVCAPDHLLLIPRGVQTPEGGDIIQDRIFVDAYGRIVLGRVLSHLYHLESKFYLIGY